jgi:hypothetical protein
MPSGGSCMKCGVFGNNCIALKKEKKRKKKRERKEAKR